MLSRGEMQHSATFDVLFVEVAGLPLVANIPGRVGDWTKQHNNTGNLSGPGKPSLQGIQSTNRRTPGPSIKPSNRMFNPFLWGMEPLTSQTLSFSTLSPENALKAPCHLKTAGEKRPFS